MTPPREPGEGRGEIMKKKQDEEILSCPFCGSFKVDICRTNPKACWVECSFCGASCQSNHYRKRAIQTWNTRANVGGFATVETDDDLPGEGK